MWGEDIPGRVVRNNSDDFVTNAFHDIQSSRGEQENRASGRTDGGEAMRLGILILKPS
jgi:hypothetical protein